MRYYSTAKISKTPALEGIGYRTGVCCFSSYVMCSNVNPYNNVHKNAFQFLIIY